MPTAGKWFGRLLLPATLTYVHGHLVGLPLPFGLWEVRAQAGPEVLPVCCPGGLGGPHSLLGKTGAAVELAVPWLAEAPCCSVILSSGAREGLCPGAAPLLRAAFHEPDDRLFPSLAGKAPS